jgi:hypothetical protein
MGRRTCSYRLLVGKCEERDHSGDVGIDGRILLKLIFKKWDAACTGLIWLRIRTDGGLL